MSANDTFLLGFGENVHDAFVALGPVAFGKAVHKANVNVIGAELATEAVEIGAGGGRVAGPGFGKDRDFVARNVLERFGNVRVAAVGIGRVEETKAVIVAVEEQVGEAFDAERVWCEWWPTPTVPVPMARRLVWMPVLPSVTVSAALNFLERLGKAKARHANAAEWSQAAPAE